MPSSRLLGKMAGIIRIVFGVLFLLAGIFFLLTIFGFLLGLILLILGIILVASGASARGDNERITRQQEQTNLLLQQQIALSAAQANRAAYPPQYAPIPAPPPAPSAGERFCPVCGQGNLRASAFCAKCGKPLPPPPRFGEVDKAPIHLRDKSFDLKFRVPASTGVPNKSASGQMRLS